jgi:hypothetical protein
MVGLNVTAPDVVILTSVRGESSGGASAWQGQTLVAKADASTLAA